LFYLVQREDADSFVVADDIDPTYAKGLEAAMKAGVEVVCYACRLTPQSIDVTHPVKVNI
ncbi:MAG: DNA/RNA nuclease SfsA, partial [Rhodospirillales bacterium]